MKKKLVLLAVIFGSITMSSFAQIEIDEPANDDTESTTQGFFVKGGKQKIRALECYNFKDLIVSFDLKKEHFLCNYLLIELMVGNERKNTIYTYLIDQGDFSELFKGKKYAYFKVFSSDDMEEKSDWVYVTNARDNTPSAFHPLTRSDLQYTTNKKSLNDTKISVKVSRIKTEIKVTLRNAYWNWTDKWEEVNKIFSIELKNRIHVKAAKYYMSGFPKTPVSNGECF